MLPQPLSTSLLYVAMSQSSFRRASCAALFIAGLVCSTSVQAQDRITAMQTAAAIVDETGISADWVDCRGRSLPRACTQVRGSRDLIVRLTPRFIPKAAAAGEAVRVGDADSGLILGVAVVDRETQVGTLATIFLENVQEVGFVPGGHLACPQ